MPISATTFEMLRQAVGVENGVHLARLENWLDGIEQEVERPQPQEQSKKGHRRNLSVRIPVGDLLAINQDHSATQLSSPRPKFYIRADVDTPLDEAGDSVNSTGIKFQLTCPSPVSEYFSAVESINGGDETIDMAVPPSAETIRLQNMKSFNDNQAASAKVFDHGPTDFGEEEPVQEWFFDRPSNSWVRDASLVQVQDEPDLDVWSYEDDSLTFSQEEEQAFAELLAEEDRLEQMQVKDLVESIDSELEADALLEQYLVDELDKSYRLRAKPGSRARQGRAEARIIEPNGRSIAYAIGDD